jgi:predicted site-specific integrase-resolvase
MDHKYVKIGKASEMLGLSTQTLIRWHKSGQLIPDKVSDGGTRYYLVSSLKRSPSNTSNLTIAYARVSSYDQKDDLETQGEALKMFCTSNGWSYELIKDVGSGMNYNKSGLKKLLKMIHGGTISRLVLTERDRLLRFGSELIFEMCELNNIEVVIINTSDDTSFEQELAQDVLQIITVFSARLYGSRSNKNKKLVKTIKEQMEASE